MAASENDRSIGVSQAWMVDPAKRPQNLRWKAFCEVLCTRELLPQGVCCFLADEVRHSDTKNRLSQLLL